MAKINNFKLRQMTLLKKRKNTHMNYLYFKKYRILLLLIAALSLLSLSSCNTANEGNNNQGDGNKNQGGDVKKIFDGVSDVEILEQSIKNLEKEENYFIEATGKTKAKAFITYTQNTKTLLYYMNGKFYNKIDSTSALVDHHHELLCQEDIIKYYDSSQKEVLTKTIAEYRSEFGKVPNKRDIFNYRMETDAIISSSRNFQNDKYEITYNIDPEKIGDDLKIQMKAFGDLNENPIFNAITLIIEVDEEGKLLKFKNIEKYSIVKNVLGKPVTMPCTQELESIVYYNNYQTPTKGEYFDFN